MKKIISFAFVVAVLFTSVSCSRKNDLDRSDVASLKVQYEKLSKTPATESGVISDASQPFITGIDTKKLNLLKQIRLMTPPWVGPNYITGSLRLIASNQRVVISSADSPALPTGTYICDVYSLSAEVLLPADAVGRIDLGSMAKYGYSNWTTKQKGVVYNQAVGPNGNSLAMFTYSILPKYNVLGQPVSAPAIPAGDLTGLQFAYSYIQ